MTCVCAMGKYTMNDDVFFPIIEAEKEILYEGILFLLVTYIFRYDRLIELFLNECPGLY